MLSFLCDDPRWNDDVTSTFADYREELVRGLPTGTARKRLRSLLLRVMCRTERPMAVQNNMLLERVHIADELLTDDVRGYTALRRVADAVGAPVTLEYWKSAPYFLNFTEGYQVGDKLRSAAREGSLDLVPLLRGAQLLDREALGRYDAVDLGNSRLRRLAANTVERGWWQLLWVPPSMPYHEFGEPFAVVAAEGMTKQLLFSSWTATPTAVAGLLSYEAERRIVEGTSRRNDPAERRRVATRLDYRVDAGRPAAMSTLALFWPHPRLAAACDPLATAQRHSEALPPLSDVHDAVRATIIEKAPEELRTAEHVGETHAWEALFRWPGALPPGGLTAVDLTDALTGRGGDEQDTAGTSGLRRHVELAVSVAAESRRSAARAPGDVADDLALLGLHGPGNVAWRAFGRLLEPNSSVTAAGHWTAAAVLASGLRSLFNRMESTLLLDRLALDAVYWRSVLRYAAAGGLQAVLDEYLHHLRGAMGELRLNDAALRRIADKAASALALRPSDYRAFDPAEPDNPIRLLSRFALRYGGRRNDVDDARQPEVRNAFNSPFWPFVLATTSVGQEGIDFHWWCSTVVHWNTPANPVDFEQREGRVHRFGGHAVRRNVSAAHRAAALKAPGADVWANAYAAARRESGDLLGDFAPYWVYPGEAKIERHLMPYPLSRDVRRMEMLRDDLVVYRLAFGQPRQEDMLDLLRRNGVTADVAEAHALCLRPDGPGHRHGPA